MVNAFGLTIIPQLPVLHLIYSDKNTVFKVKAPLNNK